MSKLTEILVAGGANELIINYCNNPFYFWDQEFYSLLLDHGDTALIDKTLDFLNLPWRYPKMYNNARKARELPELSLTEAVA